MNNLTHIGHKTIQYFDDENNRCIMYHSTVIFKHLTDGTIELNSGGFKTMYTKKRINQQLPKNVQISQKQYNWFVNIDGEPHKFFDGMQLIPTEDLTSYTVKE